MRNNSTQGPQSWKNNAFGREYLVRAELNSNLRAVYYAR